MEKKIKIDDVSWVNGFHVDYYDGGGSGNTDYDPLYWPKPIIKDGVVQFLQFDRGGAYVLASDIIGVRIRHEDEEGARRGSMVIIAEALLSSGQEVSCGSEEYYEELVNGLLLVELDYDIPEDERGEPHYNPESVRSRANGARFALYEQVFVPYAAAVLKAAQEARR